jgi:lauroyl/myristoyl acyltransferase
VNINPKIMSALSSLGLPVVPNVYTGTATDYITFNYSHERPGVYADDEDILDETTVQVHYFTKNNPQANKKAIRRLLRSAGFSIISTSELYESDTGYTHVIVEVCIEGSISD